MLSNRSLAVVAMVLIVGAIGDGMLYNRPVVSPSIYPINNPDTIEVKYNDKVILALRKSADQQWLITAPFHAPAMESRVALLLDSNNQTNRSYTTTELAASSPPGAGATTKAHGTKEATAKDSATNDIVAHLFSDPVELRVNRNLFRLGAIEPVSQLRYVAADTKIYLQADYVIPLLQSPKSTFTDLSVTKTVDAVTIIAHTAQTDTAAHKQSSPTAVATSPAKGTDSNARKHNGNATDEQLAEWQNLEALAVVDAALLNHPPIATATIERARNQHTQLDISRFQALVALRPADHQFAYLVSEEQAEKLGICVYC